MSKLTGLPPIVHKNIRTIMGFVANNVLILPALQREFVWKPKQIEKLFDSLMQNYPINTSMFWSLDKIGNQNIDFYTFLNPAYTVGNPNPLFTKSAATEHEQHLVVIDGQQRITSLYIALCGSYKKTSAKLPQELYLRLDAKSSDPEMEYDFKFMTNKDFDKATKKGEVWVKVKDAFNNTFKKSSFLRSNCQNLSDEQYDLADSTLNDLLNIFNANDVINYYEIGADNIDAVLDVFVRTNSGGTKLSKGDLLMSAITTSWASSGYNARGYAEDVISDVKTLGYKVDKDWVLKCCLMLVGSNLDLTVSTFLSVSSTILNNKVDIKNSVTAAFELIARWNILENALTTKLAIIPMVYYIYKFKLWGPILSNNSKAAIYSDMRNYLFRAILKNLFDSHTDGVLTNIRKIIDATASDNSFPYKDIENKYQQLTITNKDIKDFLSTRKSDSLAFSILNIIYSLGNKTLTPTYDYDIDHMHPKKSFTVSNLAKISFATQQDANVANDGVSYDTILNLELLDSTTNRSKNKQALDTWFNSMNNPTSVAAYKNNHFIPKKYIDIANFGTFINEREKLLKAELKKL